MVNKYRHKPTPFDVYIGRGSPLGNKFTHIKDKMTKAQVVVATREEVIASHARDLDKKLGCKDEDILKELKRIKELEKKGEVFLVCFCKPKSCHGDYIKKTLDSMTSPTLKEHKEEKK